VIVRFVAVGVVATGASAVVIMVAAIGFIAASDGDGLVAD